jgi:hypothetical protein
MSDGLVMLKLPGKRLTRRSPVELFNGYATLRLMFPSHRNQGDATKRTSPGVLVSR